MSSYPDAIIIQMMLFTPACFNCFEASLRVVQVEITSSKIIIFFPFIFEILLLFKAKTPSKFFSLSSLVSFDCCFTFFIFLSTFFSYFIHEILAKYLQRTSLEL
ncbi:MAG: hypothetical protein LBF15_06100 [Candidatus Peribacteria bacterium]|nr:hypothetical protein [Candidatus Peribacteria bacterium]